MAWNEPGGSGNKDPWNNNGRGGGDGPPDLDEVVKKMQQKLSGLFGGGSGSGSSSSSTGGSGGLGVIFVVLILIAAWALSGLYTIEEGKRGVVLQFGKYTETTLPGFHWFPRFIQSYEEVDISLIRDAHFGYTGTSGRGSNVDREAIMLTQDENIVNIHLAVQYKVKSASDFLFKVSNPVATLRQATEAAIREIVGKNKMDFILTEGRSEVALEAKGLIQRILDRYETGLEITSVNIQKAQPPEQVQAAFEDAVKAREDNERLKNEAEAYANDILPKANGAAARQLAEATAYKESVIAEARGQTARFLSILTQYKAAPEVTKKRMYLDTLESVFSNSSKVLVDVKNGNNLLYLPLDKIINSSSINDDHLMSAAPAMARDSSSGERQSRSLPDSSTRDDSRRGR